MHIPFCSGAGRARKIIAIGLTVACLVPWPTTARAQAPRGGADVLGHGVLFSPVAESAAGPIGRSLAGLNGRAVALDRFGDGPTAPNDAQRGYGGRRGRGGRGGRGDRAMWGLVLGAVGGLVVGGLVGAEATSASSCHCDDPALHGFAIGAPIGAVVGGFLGYAVAR